MAREQERRLLVGWAGVSLFVVSLLVSAAQPASAVPRDPPYVAPEPCDRVRGVALLGYASVVGLRIVGRTIVIDARTVKLAGGLGGCPDLLLPLPSYEWTVIEAPPQASRKLGNTNTLRPSLLLDRVGLYRVQLTACPRGCSVPINVTVGGRRIDQTVSIGPLRKVYAIRSLSEIAVTPQTRPFLPSLASTAPDPTNLAVRTVKCAGGGGVSDPQWVTTSYWEDADDYELAEGIVWRSRVSTTDNLTNHSSHDHIFDLSLDRPYRRLVSADSANYLHVERERNYWPEGFRPTNGDRVSVFGHWIYDCGHFPFHAEIHPAVGVAVHRERPVPLPGEHGANVFVPGIVTDIYFGRFAGGVLACLPTSLHWPAPRPEPGCIGPAPLDRRFTFNVYLPPDPHAEAVRAGLTPPPVPLYVSTDRQEISWTRRSSENGASWLEVTVDLRQYTDLTFRGHLRSAWALPAPDNWGLSAWRLALKSIDVHDDSDPVPKGDGDWRLWANLSNGSREWVNLFDCDNCVGEGKRNFGSDVSTGPGRKLGSDILVFPDRSISLLIAGFEADDFHSDDIGLADTLITPDRREQYCANDCTFTISGSGNYFDVEYQLGPIGFPRPSLSARARDLYNHYVIRGEEPIRCATYARACVVGAALGARELPQWHAELVIISPDAKPLPAGHLRMYKRQSREVFAFHDAPVAEFRRSVERAQRTAPARLNRVLSLVRGKIDRSLRNRRVDEVRVFVSYLKANMPKPLFERHFRGLPTT